MLRLANITLRRGARILLKDASATVFPGHRVGLVGANGAGNSGLFALVLGGVHQGAGELELPARWVFCTCRASGRKSPLKPRASSPRVIRASAKAMT